MTGTLHEAFSHLWKFLDEFFLEWEMFQTKVVEKIKVHILYSVTFVPKIVPFRENVEKCGGAREAADDNMAARSMLD